MMSKAQLFENLSFELLRYWTCRQWKPQSDESYKQLGVKQLHKTFGQYVIFLQIPLMNF